MNKGSYMRYILLLLLLTACGKSEFPIEEPSIYGRWIIQSKTCDDTYVPLYKNTLTIDADTATSIDEMANGCKQTVTYSHSDLVFTAANVQCNSACGTCPTLADLSFSAETESISSTAMIFTTTHATSICESKLVR